MPSVFKKLARSCGDAAVLHNQTLHWIGAVAVLVIRALVIGPGQ
jgi:hypothetical protein